MKNFAITGVAGYIAPRHLQAIKETGNNLIAATDPHDSVGILDRYFFNTRYFREFERFDRYIEKFNRREGEGSLDYLTVCSPNYLHDAHIRYALRAGAHAICEKPLVLTPWNLDALEEFQEEYGKNIYTVLQLRLHPAIIALRKKIQEEPESKKKHQIELTYITSRGQWYLNSWKGNKEQSGGLVTNIGIHFFDMLIWIFGDTVHSELHFKSPTKSCGLIDLKNAQVKWMLSIENNDLPEETQKAGATTFRSIKVDGEEVEFSGGFTDLHTMVYKDILEGGGYGPEDARASILLAYSIRNAKPIGISEHSHPLIQSKGY